MPRRDRPLAGDNGPLMQFAADLRRLREKAGKPTYRQLGQRAHYSAGVLSTAANGLKLPTLAVTLAYVDACGGDTEQWRARWFEVAALLAGEKEPDREDDLDRNGDCPYVGLAAFQIEDAGRFFGREQLIDDLLKRLAARRFVAVFGASGAGKSSLLRAGLMPRLTDAVLFTPGPHPLEECAIRLAAAVHAEPGHLFEEFTADPRNLHRRMRQSGRDFVIVVDQFEEIFTVCHDVVEREQFLSALLTAATAENAVCRVVIGVRADFYAHCTMYPALVRLLPDAQVAVGPMSTDELRRAIVQPAIDAGCTVEGALLATLTAQAAGQAGILPPLSHALRETWRRRRGNTLTLTGFQAAGGIEGALAQTAEALYHDLDPRRQPLARQLLTRLVEPGEGTEDTKCRIRRDELDPDDPDTDLVLARLAESRLITLDATTVELAHESLIRAWPRLREWLAEDREGLRTRRKLTEAAAAWVELGKEAHALYRGTRLSVAREWDARANPALTRREREFLDASAAAQDRERVAAQRRTRRLRQLLALLTVALLVAVTSTVWAVRAERTAAQQRNAALSRQVALQAQALAAGNPALAAQLGLAAYRLAPTAQARSTLLSMFGTSYVTRLTRHTDRVESVAFSPDGRLAATASADHTARLWDIANPHQPIGAAILSGHTGPVKSVAFGPDGHLLATAGDDGTVRIWDITDISQPIGLATTTGHTGGVLSVAFGLDGRTMATAGRDGAARLWDIADPRRPTELATLTGHRDSVVAVAFSPDGRTVATAGDDGTARLWDITDPHRPIGRPPLTGHTDRVAAVAFSPDGHTLATAGYDRTARLWDVTDPQRPTELTTLAGQTGLRSVAFSPDGHTIATAGEDNTAHLWDITDPHRPSETTVLRGHTGGVVCVAFNRDGHTLATASDDYSARLWDMPEPILAGHTDAVLSVAFGPDGHTLATGGADRTARLWDVADPYRPRAIDTVTGPIDKVWGTAIGPDGHTLATAGEGAPGSDTARLWDVTRPANPTPMALPNHGDHVYAIAISPTGRTLVTVGEDTNLEHHGTLRLWDISNPREPVESALVSLPGETGYSVAFSPDGRTLATGIGYRTARLWDITDPRRPVGTAVIPGHTGTVESVAFSPDGRVLATASADHTARLWDVTDRSHPTQLAVLAGYTGVVRSVAFNRDGSILATGTADHTARLWDVTDPRHPSEFATLTGHTDALRAIAFSPDGRTLATTSDDHTARLWSIDIERVATRICEIANPRITRSEWDQYLPDVGYRPPCP
ncbi:hypothetical protein [Nocardia arthritidis]|uniref:HTH cro/C1-type domain-containing protein n=1 Tax=Nocardia arthritidis TaxID=228602 RepID=A0A6G9YA98_9NOCA|nr:hypothetical protein [Nocardia arthritidis]QIS10088.1 hypothetical protein F5544_10965 [Nocardia arthritidis]